MARFLTNLRVEKANGRWRLIAPLVFDSDVIRHVIGVPKGFKTDFASVPRLPLAFLLAGDTAHRAAVIHDYLYCAQFTTRKEADLVFREAMEVTRESAWRRSLMYWSVRLFGGGIWRSRRKESENGGAQAH